MHTFLERLKIRFLYVIVTAVLGWLTSRFGLTNLPTPESLTDWLVAAGALQGFADWLKLFKQHAWTKLWAKIKPMIPLFGD